MSRIAKAAAVALGTGAVVFSGAGLALADAGAAGTATGNPGVLSGNVVQVPLHVPVNACGDTVDVIGLLNPAFGSKCDNPSGTATTAATTPANPPVTPRTPAYGV
ncbi:chaplin [Streptomyces sp. NPDC046805]|uniref:chaplin n=1 Tax=Streptomyces sp. NPDC046805 TaxID=3155134 RepID=UPI003400490B